jgi:hypothetical protein
MNTKTLCTSLLAAVTLTAPAFADRKITVYRDRDGDGHYNKKTYKVDDCHRGYGYRSYGYYNYRPYYGCRPYYYGPRVGVTIYSRPAYYTTTQVYRGYAVRDSLAADVQRALARRGYYRGSIDGDIGAGSRAAIRAYQRDHGLVATGRIDSALLRSLRIS